MTKFNIGDKVRLSKKYAVSDGTEGIVTGKNVHGHTVFRVTKACGPYTQVGNFRNEWADNLVLVEEAPIKVGDLVHYDSDGSFSWDGIEGIVTKMVGDETYIKVTKGYAPSGILVGEEEAFSTRFFSKIEAPKPAIAAHYAAGMPEGIDALAIMKEQGWDKEFMLGSILKYITRCQHKGQYLKDLKKIRDYADKLIALEEA